MSAKEPVWAVPEVVNAHPRDIADTIDETMVRHAVRTLEESLRIHAARREDQQFANAKALIRRAALTEAAAIVRGLMATGYEVANEALEDAAVLIEEARER